MSHKAKVFIPLLGMLLVVGYAAVRVVTTDADEIKQALPATLSNLAEIKRVEVKDAAEQILLSGDFGAPAARGNEFEREAVLATTGVDADATGAAEIEISTKTDGVIEKEFELTVERLAAGATYKLLVDQQEVASFTTDHRGNAELELSNVTPK